MILERRIVDITGQDRTVEQLQRDYEKRFESGGGGGGDDGGMLGRLTRLEVNFEHVSRDLIRIGERVDGLDSRLRSVEGELKTLAERIAHLPSKGFIVVTVMTGFALVAAVFGFHDQIVALLARP